MSKLKRTYIELVKNPEEVLNDGEPEIERVWTPAFIPWKTVKLATKTLMELEKKGNDFELMEKMEAFVAEDVFAGKITVDDLGERLHAPDAAESLRKIVEFASSGSVEDELEEKKAFLEKKL